MMSSSFIVKRITQALHVLRRLRRADDGVALVEFAITLPMMIFTFAVIIEGSRMMLAYESAITGVRDATRFLARMAPSDLCVTGASVAGYATQLGTLVTQGVSGQSVFPSAVTVGAVTPSYRCVSGSYRGGTVPVAQVSAVITVTFPFSTIFTWLGASRPTLVTTVTDQARVYGS